MPRFIRKHSIALGVVALASILALSWDSLLPTAWAQDPFGAESQEDPESADDPFGAPSGRGRFNGLGEDFGGRGGFGQEASPEQLERERERERDRAHETRPARQQVVWADSHSDASERIRRALASELKPSGLEFEGAPLEEVVSFLRDEYGIEVQLDATALDDLGIGYDDPITVHLRNISLRAALRIMLRQCELTYLIADEVLLVSTEEAAKTRTVVAVYPVADLTQRGEHADQLIDALISTVASETWAENGGGDSEIAMLPGGLLVVSQTLAVHERIADVLTAIRQAKRLND